jgi:adenylyltransferase/sulfurtransferase
MNEQIRYQRQLKIDEWGPEAQARLKASRIVVAGAGGLGSPVSLYLAAAGVGRLVLWDYDEVALSNLNRQILYTSDDIGREKSAIGASHISRLNPEIQVQGVSTEITEETLTRHASNADVIVDCLDSMSTRFLLNLFAVSHSIPLVHGGIHGTNGQVTVVPAGGKPCLECVFAGMEDRKGVPVLGAAVGIIGSMEALEALKLVTGYGRTLAGRLLICEGYAGMYQEIALDADPNCPVCGG